MSPDEPLDAAALRTALGERLIGNRIIVLEETTSTNDVIAELAPKNSEGLVVFAERQTAGRGQYGRRWESAPRKGLWLSVLLRPKIPVNESSRLTNLLATVVADAIGGTLGIGASIKPPNDVYIGSRKVAGVLMEMRVESSGGYCAVAGLGINVNQAIDDFPPELRETAGSLRLASGNFVDRLQFAAMLLRALDKRYRSARGNNATGQL